MLTQNIADGTKTQDIRTWGFIVDALNVMFRICGLNMTKVVLLQMGCFLPLYANAAHQTLEES